jgi:hypothetical protein
MSSKLPPGWYPMESAPRDGTPIVGQCVHAADPYFIEDGKQLTTYGAHAEGLGHVPDGLHVVVFGGEFTDDDGGYIPAWWFRSDSDWEAVANPIMWAPIPKVAA